MVDYLITLTTTLLRLHQSTNIKQDLLLCTQILFTQNENNSGSVSLKYIGPKIWSNIPEKLKSSSPYSSGKKYKKVLLSCQTSCWSSFYMLVTFCNIALMPLFSLLSTSIVTHPTPVHRHAFPHCFLLLFFRLFYLTLIWRFLLLLLLLVQRLQLKFGLC